MNEKELKKAEQALKVKEEEFEKKITAQAEESSKREKEFEEKLKARDAEFDEHVKETRKELQEEAAGARRGVVTGKGCYRDSKFWKSEEGITLKAKQAKN